MQKYFCSIFGSNEDFKICVRGLMNFMNFLLAKYEGRSYLMGHIDENQSSSQEFIYLINLYVFPHKAFI